MKTVFTPERITSLEPNEIFVFGSNLKGNHAGGAARAAVLHFGAAMGQGVGLQGQSYAIPTMSWEAREWNTVDDWKKYVFEFIAFATERKDLTFYVTKIGCGIAGYTEEEVAPLFWEAMYMDNVILPKSFCEILEREKRVADWDPQTFLAEYTRLMENVRMGISEDYYKVKQLRADEFQNNVKIVNRGYYTDSFGKRHVLGMSIESRFYRDPFNVIDIQVLEQDTKIEVINEDCLATAQRLIMQGYNPAVLNMASRSNPGGGVLGGAGAQEETIFRRSDLFRSLYQYASYAPKYGLRPSRDQYPLDRNFGGIYSAGVTVFREDESRGYALMDDPVKMAFISVAGMNRPMLDPYGMICEDLVPGVKNKIRTILRIGLQNGHDSLVLGALGCGAFRNPPRHVASLFNEVINEPEFRNKYKLLVFAILEDHNSKRSHNPEGNFKPFYEEFMR